MKTTIEINGYEIVIEEVDGVISVSAVKDEEVIEEFEIQSGESQSEDDEESQDFGGEEVQDFEEFGSDEDESQGESQGEFEDDELEGDDDDSDDDDDNEPQSQEEDEERKLESFNSFLKKRK